MTMERSEPMHETGHELDAVAVHGPEHEAEHEPELMAEHELEPVAVHEPEAEAEHEPEPEAEHGPEAVAEHEPEAEAEHEPEAVAEHEAEPEAEHGPEPVAEHEPEAQAEHEPEAEALHEAEHGPEPVAEHEPEAEAVHEPEPEAVHEPEPEALHEGAADVHEATQPEPRAMATEPVVPPSEPAPAEAEAPFQLFPIDDVARFRRRWDALQAGFVDDPKGAAEQADQLVSEVVGRVSERHRTLRDRLGRESTERVDTETLRLTVRQYRFLLMAVLGDQATA